MGCYAGLRGRSWMNEKGKVESNADPMQERLQHYENYFRYGGNIMFRLDSTRPRSWVIRFGQFTLTELLVVMAILSILIALLTTSLRNLIEKTRTFQCSHQLKGLSFAMSVYTGDHQYYPPGWYNDYNGGIWSWDDYLGYGGYDGRKNIPKSAYDYGWIRMWDYATNGIPKSETERLHQYRCPTQSGWGDWGIGTYWERTYAMAEGGINSWAWVEWKGRQYHPPYGLSGGQIPWSRKADSIPAPSSTLMLCEQKANPGDIKLGNLQGAVIGNPSQHNRNGYFRPFHLDRWNYLFIDGSLRTLYPAETIKNAGNYPGYMWSVDPNDDK